MPVLEETTSTVSYDRAQMTVGSGLNFFVLETDLLGPQQTLRRTKHLPEQLIQRYLREALKATDVKRLDDGHFFAEIPGFDGVWASAEDLGECGNQLRDALLDWIVLKIEHDHRDLPVVGDINLNVL
jgi:predicted RNase H-like HicB family nuclease